MSSYICLVFLVLSTVTVFYSSYASSQETCGLRWRGCKKSIQNNKAQNIAWLQKNKNPKFAQVEKELSNLIDMSEDEEINENAEDFEEKKQHLNYLDYLANLFSINYKEDDKASV
nr:uncharacterized protein LOC100203200 [Hydra vulgaris]